MKAYWTFVFAVVWEGREFVENFIQSLAALSCIRGTDIY